MEIKQLESKEKIITFFGEIKNSSVESAIKDIAKINSTDLDYIEKCQRWAAENGHPPAPVRLSPIRFYLSTSGGSCYDGMALHDALEASQTPVELICSGKIMSMGIVVALGAKIRKAYRNTTFMIHQVHGITIGTLGDMEDTVTEVSRINGMLFKIIKEKTRITDAELNDVLKNRKDWFLTADEALDYGIITEIVSL
jgi:ATP-dependent Clp endopeptidase proteolytic subunit ClpP